MVDNKKLVRKQIKDIEERYINAQKSELVKEPLERVALVSRRETFRRDWSGADLQTVGMILKSVYSGKLDILYDFFDKMMDDPVFAASVNMRQLFVSSNEIKVNPGDDTPEAAMAAEIVRKMISKIPWLNIALRRLLMAVFTGMECSEIIWDEDEYNRTGILCPLELKTIHPKKLYYTIDTMELVLSQRFGPDNLGRDVKLADLPNKFIVHAPLTLARYAQYSGIFYMMAYRYIIRNLELKYGLAGSEKWAFDRFIASVPDMNSSNMQDLLSQMDGAAADGSIIKKKDVDLETISSPIATSGDNWIIKSIYDWIGDEFQMLALGGVNIFKSAEGGTKESTQMQKDNLIRMVQEDAINLMQTLEAYLVKPFLELNADIFFPGGIVPALPKLKIEVRQFPDLDTLALGTGVITVNQVLTHYGLPTLLVQEGGELRVPGTVQTVYGPDILNNQLKSNQVSSGGDQTQTWQNIDDNSSNNLLKKTEAPRSPLPIGQTNPPNVVRPKPINEIPVRKDEPNKTYMKTAPTVEGVQSKSISLQPGQKRMSLMTKEEQAKDIQEKLLFIIRKQKGKYVLRSKKTGKVLGKHKTKKEAIAQEQAIEISKHKK